jgi:hypothetical protein
MTAIAFACVHCGGTAYRDANKWPVTPTVTGVVCSHCGRVTFVKTGEAE